ncbi:hypothetical protein ACDN41_11860 [Priestia aryabhattai]|uniref:hypothetical protein n=1 Tax=Priestia aryabhattai TaxID=412384 RepID=UPI003532677C
MTNQTFKQQTFGRFTAKGSITVTEDSFQLDLKGKNNPSWNYSRINMKMEDGKGGVFFLNAQDGFSTTNGRVIYANIKDSREQMQVQFADRFNEAVLEHLDDRAFVRVAFDKVEVEGKQVWNYQKFLTVYDAITFLKPRLQTGMKLFVSGNVNYSEYNDNLNKDLQIQQILVLPEDESMDDAGFKFKQNVLLTPESLDDSKFEDELTATINAKLYYTRKNKQTKQKEAYTLNLPLVIRAAEDKKDKVRKMLDKYFTIEEDTVRRIQLDGKFNTGYVSGQVTEEDLPEEAKELIEDGFYTMEEVLKMYAKRDRVDELLVTRPVLYKAQDAKIPTVDMDDESYKPEDLIFTQDEEEPVEETIEIEEEEISEDEDLSFLDDLD